MIELHRWVLHRLQSGKWALYEISETLEEYRPHVHGGLLVSITMTMVWSGMSLADLLFLVLAALCELPKPPKDKP